MPSEAKAWEVVVEEIIEKEKKIFATINRLFSIEHTCYGVEEIKPNSSYDIVWGITNNTLWPTYGVRLSVKHSDGVEEEIEDWGRIKAKDKIEGRISTLSGSIEGEEVIKVEIQRVLTKKEVECRIEVKS